MVNLLDRRPGVGRPAEPGSYGLVRPTGEPRDPMGGNPPLTNPGPDRGGVPPLTNPGPYEPYPDRVPMQTVGRRGVVLREDASTPLVVLYAADRPPATPDGKGQGNTAGGNLPPVIPVKPGGGAIVTEEDQQRNELTQHENNIIDQANVDL